MSTLMISILHLLLLLLSFEHSSESASVDVPLWTNSRWVVDTAGERVKLGCVNWVAHMEAAVAEGLSRRPVAVVVERIKEMGFNCVRLTWAVPLVTDSSLGCLSVRESFLRLNLTQVVDGFHRNNPSYLDMSLIQAFQAVVTTLTNNKVMVILDNHVSKPGWCCNPSDGNGFFKDEYFDPKLWIKGLKIMATLFKHDPYVVGMSLRNELRGPRQNTHDWYKYMRRGAKAVWKANPNVVVIVSGLTFDTDLSFLHQKMIKWDRQHSKKLAFEMHWYAFSDGQGGQTWANGNPNEVCHAVLQNITRMSGFLLDHGYPLFVSEFGVDLRGTNVAEYVFLNCFMSWATEYDVDWALWTLVGSYYLRQGIVGLNEYYGVLDEDWYRIRNASFLERISVIQSPLRGPRLSKVTPHKIIFHPQTGLCIIQTSPMKSLKLGNCSESNHWSYTSKKLLKIKGKHKHSSSCLQAQGINTPVRTTVNCHNKKSGTVWETLSDSKLHLGTNMGMNNNITLCLDVDSSNNIVTNACKCLSGNNYCDPTSQWFKLIVATI